ncbi:hypothetical protein DPMN_169486 [Dreissena polymorpha]|uniref:Uncharacterized protein n=1 Tax=Dreissena polymorpha TaxID=45954 RepID=A0A9D4ICA5_DREPO|nr:hypothetical protein DPMN_169486 [Dreissena polymorpha]
MEECYAVTSATDAGVTEVDATLIKGKYLIESATMEGRDEVTSATETGVTEGITIQKILDRALQCNGKQTNNLSE